MQRRKFLRLGMTGLTALGLGSLAACGSSRHNESGGAPFNGNGDNPGGDAGGSDSGETLVQLSIEEALFEMVDGSLVYHWAFQDRSTPEVDRPHLPGPVIQAVSGQPLRIEIRNNLPTPHGFAIHDLPEATVTVPPGEVRELVITAPAAGCYLYLDPLNAPVNRLLGLHGALLVRPAQGPTPYSAPTPAVTQLFADLGTTGHFPPNALSPAGWQSERFRIWLFHQVDPRFNARVEGGETLDPAELAANFLPRYFLINGKSGAFAAHDEATTIKGQIGQPMLVHQLNAGLFTHSPHLHANHVYVTAINQQVQENVVFVDTFTLDALDRVDWVVPFIRPPDIPGDQRIPLRELIPNELALTIEGPNGSPGVRQSPLLYPMHCHNELSQSAAGGNYPQGAIAHFEILGDIDGVEFPH